jgi:hypothetical protein
MPLLSTSNLYGFYGNAWSLWLPYDEYGNLNIVSGVRTISHAIISVCLIKKGEDPLHPDFGIAVDLFEPLSNYAPEYWVYHAELEIKRWVAGLDQLFVRVSEYTNYQNALRTEIYFTPKGEPDRHLLTFPFYSYQGAIWNGDVGSFLDEIYLDEHPLHRF